MKVDTSYMGNPNLKRIGIKINYTYDQVEELIKCSNDHEYFIKQYCKIVSLDSEDLIDFNLYHYQERFLDAVHNNRRVISMQPRQSGKTIVIGAYLLWNAIFKKNQTIAILANKKDIANEVLGRCKLMYEALPLWMQHGVKKWNDGNIELENGSKMFTRATSKDGIRGKSCNILYVDETAIIPNSVAEDFFTAIYPVISSGKKTKVILTSTPLGYNHFWKYWNDAEKGLNGFVPVRVHYWEHPGRDDQWAKEQKELLGELKYNQEVLCAFLGSSNTLLSGDTLSKLSSLEYIYTKDNLDIIEKPIANHIYFITVDTAEGIGGDYSAFTIIDVTEFPYKIVGKYRDNTISHLAYPDIVYKVAKEYNNALVLVEINSVGLPVAQTLYEDLEYEEIIFVGQEQKKGQYLTYRGKSNYGVKTTQQVKRIGCRTLKTLIEEQKLLVFDENIIQEFSTFIEHRNTFQADEGYHDDLVMSLVLFAWATQDDLFKDIVDVDTRQKILEQQLKEIENSMLPAGFFVDGLENELTMLNSDQVELLKM